MKNNSELQREVQNAITWEPLLNAAEIGVTVKDGVVSLTGIVDSYVKKMEAENAVKKVIGVKALVENIEVKLPNSSTKTDAEVAKDILSALKANYAVPNDKIRVKVEKGHVTLEGDVPWNYQREAAIKAVHFLTGVTWVTNKIQIKPNSHDAIEQATIEKALRRSVINDSGIEISVSGTTVTLSGNVPSWYQKEEAERIAWKTPGIWHVDNELSVEYDYSLVY